MNHLESRIKKLEVKAGTDSKEVNIYSLMPHLEELRARIRQEIERMKGINPDIDKRAERIVTTLRNLSQKMQAERGIHAHEKY